MRNSKCKTQNEIKKYVNPEFELVEICVNDVITTSPGTETDIMDENDGSWEIGINPLKANEIQ